MTSALYKRNRLLQNIRPSNRKEGYLKIHPQNTIEHEYVKFQIAYKLKKQGFEIWSEAIFTNGYRADLVAIKDGMGWIIEVLHSETDKMFELKIRNYSQDFELIKVRTKEFKIDEFNI